VAEIGQASVLFSILLTNNKNRLLSWFIMIILTTLQVIGNVVSSYKFIETSNTLDFQYFQDSILFWVEGVDAKLFKIIIAWITGSLLPIIALGMTALVSQNIQLKDAEEKQSNEVKEKQSNKDDEDSEEVEETIEEKPKVKYKKPIITKDIEDTSIDEEYIDIMELKTEPELKIKSNDVKVVNNITPINAVEEIPFPKVNDEIIIDKKEDLLEVPEISENFVNNLSTTTDDSFNKALEEAKEKLQQKQKIITEEVKAEEIKKEEIIEKEKPKKEQELQQKEQLEAPKEKEEKLQEGKKSLRKPKTLIKVKEARTKKLKNLKELDKRPTKGDDIIEVITESPLTEEIKEEKKTRDGVEVIDVKAIPKNEKKPVLDKWGIPINPGERNNYDKI